ncbi:MAG: glycoside hydrolase family 95 protein [Bacteroidaceae bacterium]|nr:glycoside hydrolase family 95 protein [Bacteroidaceae bacterium]
MRSVLLSLSLFVLSLLQLSAQSELPTFSSKESPVYYKIQFKTGACYLEDKGAGNQLLTNSASAFSGQKFAFIGTQNNFKLLSDKGNYFKMTQGRATNGQTGNLFVATAAESEAIALAIINSSAGTGFYEIGLASDQSKTMNQWGGARTGMSIGLWNAGDNNNPLSFIDPSKEIPSFSTEANPVYFKIRFKEGGNFLEDKGANNRLSINTAAKMGQTFALIGVYDNFVLKSDKGNYIKVQQEGGNSFFYATANAAEATPLVLLNSSAAGHFEIAQKGDLTRAMNQWGGTAIGNPIGLWSVGDKNNPFVFIDPSIVLEYDVVGVTSFTPESKHTLWYNRPSTVTGVANPWMEYSLPIGNGALGASLHGGVKTDEIQFNEKTVWQGTPNDMGAYGKYLNFGNLFATNLNEALFDPAADRRAIDYVRWLDIEKAIAGVNFSDEQGTRYTRRYIASEPDGVIAVRYTAEGDNKLSLLFAVQPGEDTNSSTPTYTADGYGYFAGKLPTVFQNFRFKVVPTGGTLTRTDKGIEVRGASEVLLIMSGGTSFDSKVAARTSGDALDLDTRIKGLVDAAAAKGWNNLLADHVDNHQSYMGRVTLNLNNAASNRDTEALVKYYNASEANKQTAEGLFLEQLYFHYGRYLHISSSRGPINVPANLQGIWNDKANAPWKSDIHTNINVQMNYWPAEPTNLSEGHLPFLNYIIDNAASTNWARAAQRGGQTKGWTVFTESNIFGGMSTWGSNYFVANAWYVSHLWQHYRYTLDTDFLRRAFPAMWSSAEFWMQRMIQDRGGNNDRYKLQPDGTYVAPNEYSAEQDDYPNEDGTAHAQQLITENLQTVAKAIEILGAESLGLTADDLARLNEYLQKTDKGLHLEQYQGDWGAWATNNGIKTGDTLLKEWKYAPYNVSNDKGHRHMSHLMCLYPLNQVQPGDEYYAAAVNSLKLRGPAATGWSMGWKVNLWARAKDGNYARRIINNALKHSTSYGTNAAAGGIYYNLYDSHAPFQIDGNFGVCAGIAELLMQSHNEVIEILPALPSAWPLGEVKGLKAVGNFTVDIAWNAGKATKVNIVSHKGADLRVSGMPLSQIEVLLDGQAAVVEEQPAAAGQKPVYLIKGVKAGQTISIDASKPAVINSIGRIPQANASTTVYDLSGRRAGLYSQGVVISNGQKVLR